MPERRADRPREDRDEDEEHDEAERGEGDPVSLETNPEQLPRRAADAPGASASLLASQQARNHAGRDAGAPGAGTVRWQTLTARYGMRQKGRPLLALCE